MEATSGSPAKSAAAAMIPAIVQRCAFIDPPRMHRLQHLLYRPILSQPSQSLQRSLSFQL